MPAPRSPAALKRLQSLEEQALAVLDKIAAANPDGDAPRWAAIARTDLQQGFMAARRAAWGGNPAPLPPAEAAAVADINSAPGAQAA